MNLPKLNLPIHICELPVSKQKLEIHPFVIKQEKSLLTSIDTKKKQDTIQVFKRLIQDCVITEKFNITELNIVDFYYLILFIRIKSTGEMIDGSLECSECKKKTEFEINLEDSIIIKNEDKRNIIVKINDNLSLRLIPAKIDSIFENDKVSIIDIVAGSIDTVIIDDKVFKDFTSKELIENILNIFTKMDFEKISKGMEQLTRLIIKFNFKCIHCGSLNVHETEDITKI